MAGERGGVARLHLRTLFGVGAAANLSDRHLLEYFATRRGDSAECAFAAIVERHGPMVLRTCRGILGDEHEAQDAFQATFLVLLRKGDTLWVRDSLGPWLHRVACRAAGRARSAGLRRRAHERSTAERARQRPAAADPDRLAEEIHEEVDRLPDRFRVPIVLCDLEGHTYEEASRLLDCPLGTVKSRLARGRERLRKRLTQRGLAPSAGLPILAHLVGGAGAESASGQGGAASRTMIRLISSGAATTGEVPGSVFEIAEGVLRMMAMGRVKFIAAGVLAAAGLAIGAGVLAQQPAERRPPAESKAEAAALPTEVPKDPRWTRSFANGATIEVVGISPHPSAAGTWWGPDGTPLAEPPSDRSKTIIGSDQDVVFRAVVVRMSGLPEGADILWGTRQNVGGGAKGGARRGGKDVKNLHMFVTCFPRGLKDCTIWCKVAAGPWQTVATEKGTYSGATSSRIGPSYSYAKAIATKRGTALSVAHDIRDVAVRLIAVDLDGKERTAVDWSGGGIKDFHLLSAEFDIKPEQIREFRLQTRPYERLEIPDVAL